jgi:hypothetical protein
MATETSRASFFTRHPTFAAVVFLGGCFIGFTVAGPVVYVAWQWIDALLPSILPAP